VSRVYEQFGNRASYQRVGSGGTRVLSVVVRQHDRVCLYLAHDVVFTRKACRHR